MSLKCFWIKVNFSRKGCKHEEDSHNVDGRYSGVRCFLSGVC
jgi:hypothetical protein